MRVLLIEDDRVLAESIELMLKSERMEVCWTEIGGEGIGLCKLFDHDIILLDLNLPDMSGFEVLQTLRASKVMTPVLILSGLVDVTSKIRGLGFGADDYMTKPVHRDELIARIHAIGRRAREHQPVVINTGDLSINLDTKTAAIRGSPLRLTGKEYQILELLSVRKGTTFTKELFLRNLYGGIDEPEGKIIDVFICKLRKKLAAASEGRNYITTVRGRGYELCDPSKGELRSPLRFGETENTLCGDMEWSQAVHSVVATEKGTWVSGCGPVE